MDLGETLAYGTKVVLGDLRVNNYNIFFSEIIQPRALIFGS